MNIKRKFRPFAEARSFARSLNLKSQKEWKQYAKGVLKGYERKPKDIPATPRHIYKDQGWQSMGDRLGNGNENSLTGLSLPKPSPKRASQISPSQCSTARSKLVAGP